MLYWNADPVALILGPVVVRWYGLLFAAGFYAGLRIMARIYAHEGRDSAELDQLLMHVVIGVVIGARLGHCFLYDPLFYIANPLEILKIWEGGLASHGGAVGFALAVWLFCRGTARPGLLWLLDRLAIPAALGGAFIRAGNFINSEILGTPSVLPWAVVFVRVDGISRHPVQLYEALAYLMIFLSLLAAYRFGRASRPGFLTGWFLVLVFSARFLLEFFKTSQAAYEDGFILAVGQWLSLPFVLIGMWLVFRDGRRPDVRPGRPLQK